MQRKSDLKHSWRVVVVGCGGNIGSHLAPHLARIPGISHLTLVDPDRYESKNLLSQNVSERDIGRSKATVQAQRLRLLKPGIVTESIVDHVENVPMGKLRADLIIGCLDNNAARLFLNEVSWHLGGIPYVDGGVRAEDGLLARVSVYIPGPDSPCLECTWHQRDYEKIHLIHPCSPAGRGPAPTNSPSFLGALTASLQAIEAWKILTGRWEQGSVGKQILMDAINHKHYVTRYVPNPECRFPHKVWEIEKLNRRSDLISLTEALSLGAGHSGPPLAAALRCAAMGVFVEELVCPACKAKKALLYLERRLTAQLRICPKCAQQMVPGHTVVDKLKASVLAAPMLEQSLKSIGFRSQDVFTINSPSGERHYEIGGRTDPPDPELGPQ